jgi:hypothetical protein
MYVRASSIQRLDANVKNVGSQIGTKDHSAEFDFSLISLLIIYVNLVEQLLGLVTFARKIVVCRLGSSAFSAGDCIR